MLEAEAIEVVKKFDLLVDYREAVLFVLDYVKTNICCAALTTAWAATK